MVMRSARPTAAEVAARLTAVKLMIRGTNGAMPTLARELRREACETIDDVIMDLGSLKR